MLRGVYVEKKDIFFLAPSGLKDYEFKFEVLAINCLRKLFTVLVGGLHKINTILPCLCTICFSGLYLLLFTVLEGLC